MLTTYQQQTSRLLHDINNVNYSLSDVNYYIGVARNQVALDAECIRGFSTYTLPYGNYTIGLNLITPPATPFGIGVAVVVRQIFNSSGLMYSRPWEWFTQFYFNNEGVPSTFGLPTTWSQQYPGTNGTIYVAPTPNATTTLQLGCVFLPIALVNDSTPEAISYPWTDAVPYFAAYMAFLNSNREQDAQAMWQQYLRFIRRGTALSTSTTLPSNFPGGAGADLAGTHHNIGAEGQQKG